LNTHRKWSAFKNAKKELKNEKLDYEFKTGNKKKKRKKFQILAEIVPFYSDGVPKTQTYTKHAKSHPNLST